VCQVALGRTEAEEHAENLHLLSKRLRGQCGLLFTNRPREDVEAFFSSFALADYARSGATATQDVDIAAGPLPQFNHALEPYLRQLGLPCKLVKSVVTLERDYRICTAGKALTSEQARLLKVIITHLYYSCVFWL
jgi:mRNA turnover protein 4